MTSTLLWSDEVLCRETEAFKSRSQFERAKTGWLALIEPISVVPVVSR